MKFHLIGIFLMFSLLSIKGQGTSIKYGDKSTNGPSTITKIIITRHAEKADDGTKDPPLTDLGKDRAVRLSFLLADFTIHALYSTPFKRTQQTLGVIAADRKLDIKTYQSNDTSFVSQLLKESTGKTVVVAGHSNSAPALVNKLIGQEKYQALDESIYTKLWVVTFKDGHFISDELWNY